MARTDCVCSFTAIKSLFLLLLFFPAVSAQNSDIEQYITKATGAEILTNPPAPDDFKIWQWYDVSKDGRLMRPSRFYIFEFGENIGRQVRFPQSHEFAIGVITTSNTSIPISELLPSGFARQKAIALEEYLKRTSGGKNWAIALMNPASKSKVFPGRADDERKIFLTTVKVNLDTFTDPLRKELLKDFWNSLDEAKKQKQFDRMDEQTKKYFKNLPPFHPSGVEEALYARLIASEESKSKLIKIADPADKDFWINKTKELREKHYAHTDFLAVRFPDFDPPKPAQEMPLKKVSSKSFSAEQEPKPKSVDELIEEMKKIIEKNVEEFGKDLKSLSNNIDPRKTIGFVDNEGQVKTINTVDLETKKKQHPFVAPLLDQTDRLLEKNLFELDKKKLEANDMKRELLELEELIYYGIASNAARKKKLEEAGLTEEEKQKIASVISEAEKKIDKHMERQKALQKQLEEIGVNDEEKKIIDSIIETDDYSKKYGLLNEMNSKFPPLKTESDRDRMYYQSILENLKKNPEIQGNPQEVEKVKEKIRELEEKLGIPENQRFETEKIRSNQTAQQFGTGSLSNEEAKRFQELKSKIGNQRLSEQELKEMFELQKKKLLQQKTPKPEDQSSIYNKNSRTISCTEITGCLTKMFSGEGEKIA